MSFALERLHFVYRSLGYKSNLPQLAKFSLPVNGLFSGHCGSVTGLLEWNLESYTGVGTHFLISRRNESLLRV